LARGAIGARAFSLAMRIRGVTRYYRHVQEFIVARDNFCICEFMGL
jgi:hypothetical protein